MRPGSHGYGALGKRVHSAIGAAIATAGDKIPAAGAGRARPVRASGFLSYVEKHALAAALALIAVGSVRIALTYPVFSHTVDEPGHIAAGMEWLDRRTYTFEPQHPPLARVMTALGPYLAGERSHGNREMPREGFEILNARNDYDHILALARTGILPFFWIACLVVYFWGRRCFDSITGLMAVLLFTQLPGILAHSSLATTDMALTAFVGAALYGTLAWFESPTLGRALVGGGCLGLAVLCKFSTFAFVPAALLTVGLWYLASERPSLRAMLSDANERLLHVAIGIAVAAVVIWAGYRFSFGPPGGAGWSVPAPEFYTGIVDLIAHNREGHDNYLLGRHDRAGWWYYFPVALSVKAPLAFLFLAVAGAATAIWRRTPARWPLACSIGILLVAMPSHINIGTRHVLPVYIGLAVVAAAFAVDGLREWRRSPWLAAAIAGSLIWLVASVGISHPDYLAYFNATAGEEPERIIADSDLDWGQDVKRLAKRLRELGATEVAMLPQALSGESVDMWVSQLRALGLPPIRKLDGMTPSPGWNAVFVFALKTHPEWLVRDGSWPPPNALWPERIKPRERVGKTALLYYFPPGQTP